MLAEHPAQPVEPQRVGLLDRKLSEDRERVMSRGADALAEPQPVDDSEMQESPAANFTYRKPVIDRMVVTLVENNEEERQLDIYGADSSDDYDDGGSFGGSESFTWTQDSGVTTSFANMIEIYTYGDTSNLLGYCEIKSANDNVYGDDHISCSTTLRNGSVVLNVGGVRSESFPFKDLSPVVEQFHVIDLAGGLPTTGGFTLNITGTHFGFRADSLEVLLYLDVFDQNGKPYMDYAS